MTVVSAVGRPDSLGPWQWPVDLTRYDTAPLLRAAEQDAIIGLGVGDLRRLARHDPAARGWQQIRRLLRPLDDVTEALEGPLTSHRRRATLDAAAVALLRCAETGRSYWAWTDEEWASLLGQDQQGFRKTADAGSASACLRAWPTLNDVPPEPAGAAATLVARQEPRPQSPPDRRRCRAHNRRPVHG